MQFMPTHPHLSVVMIYEVDDPDGDGQGQFRVLSNGPPIRRWQLQLPHGVTFVAHLPANNPNKYFSLNFISMALGSGGMTATAAAAAAAAAAVVLAVQAWRSSQVAQREVKQARAEGRAEAAALVATERKRADEVWQTSAETSTL